MKAHFRLPDGTESSFDFTVIPDVSSVCANPTILPPATYSSVHTYIVGSGMSSYTFPDFTSSGCSITYVSTTTCSSVGGDISFFSGDGMLVVDW